MKSFNLSEAIGLDGNEGAFLHADWPASARVKTLITTRNGGVSIKPFDSLNVGAHVGDDADAVAENRRRVQALVSQPLRYLHQIHSATVVDAAQIGDSLPDADASFDNSATAACAVMTADCLPVLFCDCEGTVVAAAHAGWRGLQRGVLQNTVAAMNVAPEQIMAYLGPAIGADAFEVGQDVFDAFCTDLPQAAAAFEPIGGGKYLADIYALARLVLRHEGITQIYGGTHCTVLERQRFFSYRRDGQTGRMLSAVWLQDDAV